mmetsp:Transcript_19628/g.41158  ORF Transcript_19628/g.41158 Transcript_19628/m.41158 type:complete len:143 (+) Transcript_19628:1184-1612(+)
MTTTVETSKRKFSKLAWLSICLTFFIELSHVRSFPSYNGTISLVAFYTSAQHDTDALLRGAAIFLILGSLSIVADIIFCAVWASEILNGYTGVVKFSLAAFIINIFVKAASLYSAVIVTAVASSTGVAEELCASDEGDYGSD